MRFTTPLLSSAALLAMGTVGFAADLPSKKAAAVECVRVCSQFGAGFFYVPGSDTCLRVYGRVRADYYYNQPFSRDSNTTSTRARGYVRLDSYTPTDWGPLRATTGIFVTRDSGRVTGGSGAAGGTTLPSGTDANITLDWAYIQFAGITAGRLPVSFFEFAPLGGVSMVGGNALGRGSDYGANNVLAYTAQFGGGFTATLAIEDGTERRVGIANAGADFKLLTGEKAPTYGGHSMPDVVGRLDYTGTWGQAALTGAIHQTRVGSPGTKTRTMTAATGAVTEGFGNSYTNGAVGDTVYGFAIQGGLKINLPMIAAGDALFLQAAYADGANSYTGWSTTGVGTFSTITSADVIYDPAGNAKTSKSYSVVGGLLHYWTPTVRQGVFVGYGKLDQYGKLYDAAALTVGTNVYWSPVKGLDIGAEVGYQKLTDTPNSALPLAVGSSRDNYFSRIRFQRDF